MAAHGSSVWFEAKVLLDGICTASILFTQDSSWPQVIDTSHLVDKDDKHKQILFPPFHPELLTQVWANPAQGLGTIRVLLSEGINQGEDGKASFAGLRNIVMFSFQHAPLHILENCNIAWPNPGLWWQAQQQFHNFNSPRTEAANNEAHGHSPRHQRVSKETTEAPSEAIVVPQHLSNSLMSHPALKAQGSNANNPFWSQLEPVHDPFISATAPNCFPKAVTSRGHPRTESFILANRSRSTSTSHDESMPDYSRPLSPASSRHSYPMPDYSRPPTLSGSRHTSEVFHTSINELGLSHLETTLQSHQEHDVESQFIDMMASYSPRKHSNTSGISAPSNTRVSSAANSPPLPSGGMSAAAIDRASSYTGHPRAVSMTTRDPPPRALSHNALRASSDFRVTPSSTNADLANDKRPTQPVIKTKPVGRPKGRKEGKNSEVIGQDVNANTSQRQVTTSSSSIHGKQKNANAIEKTSDGKRKRASTGNGAKVELEDRLTNIASSSPTTNTSKIGRTKSPSKNLMGMINGNADDVENRAPLEEIENQF